MSIFTSNEQWDKKVTNHCQIPDTLYLWHQQLERNDTVLIYVAQTHIRIEWGTFQ